MSSAVFPAVVLARDPAIALQKERPVRRTLENQLPDHFSRKQSIETDILVVDLYRKIDAVRVLGSTRHKCRAGWHSSPQIRP
jgi:hypothetical protein